jgi:hypothetical protein
LSNFKNFVKDFPTRCSKLLESFEGKSRLQGREVTFVLSMAGTGLCIPLQRLRWENQGGVVKEREDPTLSDARAQFDALMRCRFKGSVLCKEDCEAWSYGRLSSTENDPDFWPEIERSSPLRDESVKTVVLHVRNALAHGNLFTRGEPISQMVFVSKSHCDSDEYCYLIVSPEKFTDFLHRWFDFVKTLKIPEGVLAV